jgi:hypothetical protein
MVVVQLNLSKVRCLKGGGKSKRQQADGGNLNASGGCAQCNRGGKVQPEQSVLHIVSVMSNPLERQSSRK